MYDYQAERWRVFTEEGATELARVRYKVKQATRFAGVVTEAKAIDGGTDETWCPCACLDYLVEIGDLVEVERVPPPDKHPLERLDRIFEGTYRLYTR